MNVERESMEFDVVIVGGGPAGLLAAIRLKQLAKESDTEIEVCIIEKAAEVGGHILSGAVFEPHILDQLLPDWRSKAKFSKDKVSKEKTLYLLNSEKGVQLPHFLLPVTMSNQGNYIISLGNLCQWLAEYAEEMGVHIFAGFSGAELIYDQNKVVGVITGEMGVDSEGQQKSNYQAGFELYAKYVMLAEGCRGFLSKQVIQKYQLNQGRDPEHYGLGVKEVWEIPKEEHQPGLVIHTAGWPLSESHSAGGGFLYHFGDNLVSVGLITDLSYRNTYVSPFEEMQRYKLHPKIKDYLKNGKRIAYGARALVKGGLQSLPKMSFAGGILIGDAAGTLNFAKIKGIHAAMQSAVLAAKEIYTAISQEKYHADLVGFEKRFKESKLFQELYFQRNFGPAQHKWGNLVGSAYSFVDMNLFRGRLPWTLTDKKSDRELQKAVNSKKINYPKPDGVLTFDRSSSVYLANISYDDNQPSHVILNEQQKAIECIEQYDEPATRYCPAQVYEVIFESNSKEPMLKINKQNCIHCKTCDIKDPVRNIRWVVPEGGSGPNYNQM